jgi:protein TonB
VTVSFDKETAMPRDLFDDVHRPIVHVSSRSRYTVPLSLAAHALAVLAVIAATILGPVVLPGLATSDITYTVVSIPLPPLPPAPRPASGPPRAAPNPDAAPTEMPEGITSEPDLPGDIYSTAAGDSGLVPGLSIDTVVGEPPPPPPPTRREPIRPGGNIRPPTKVHDVTPVYPAMALVARQKGVVVLEAVIDADGRVQSARVLRGLPLLNDAAIAAVSQWRYTPTLLNGVPVPVVMTVTVNFQIN